VADGRLAHAICVAVGSDETPEELQAEADVVVPGPAGVRQMLELLAAG
jgi:hypothetical protein